MSEYAFYFYTPEHISRLDNVLADTDLIVEARVDAWAIAFRDLIRNGDGESYPFNNALPAHFKVSDLCKFANGTKDGYAFIVRDTIFGNEWLFIFSGYDSSGNSPSSNYFVVPGYTTSYTHFQNCGAAADNTGYNSSSGWGLNVLYNPDYATDTFDMQFDDATELTYVGGDFGSSTALPANNSTKATAFLPSTDYPRGITMVQGGSTNVNGSDLFLSFDDTEGVLDIYMTEGASKEPDLICKMGEILDPDDVADTYTQGTMWVETTTSNPASEAGDPDDSEGFVDCFSSAGARLYNLNLVFKKTLTQENDKTVGLKFKWYPVEVSSGGTMKGHLKGNIGREATAYNAREFYLQLFAENPLAPVVTFIKITDSMMIKYPTGVPPFPFTFPTKK